jgi:hypothetical protein
MLQSPGSCHVIGAKKIVAQFDGALLSSDVGALVLREVKHRSRVVEGAAARIIDPCVAVRITHTLAGIIRSRLSMIATGYESPSSVARGERRRFSFFSTLIWSIPQPRYSRRSERTEDSTSRRARAQCGATIRMRAPSCVDGAFPSR